MMIKPPAFEELNDYYKSYWKFLAEDDLLAGLIQQSEVTRKTLLSVSPEAENYRYAEGKWMLKEVAGHLCDTERILSYRALCFSRNDKTHLPAFDENAYMINSNFASRKLGDIIAEWQTVRNATISLFSSMSAEMLDRKGQANNVTVSPRIVLYFILMHERHHVGLIVERYLKD